MSDESISHKEDKENLLYIARKIQLEEFVVAEDHYARETVLSQTDSECSVRKIGSDLEIYDKIDGLIGPQHFNNPEILAKIKPFDLTWVYGLNAKLGFINLTTSTRKEIIFASSNSPILYNYCSKEMKHLEGHQYLINNLAVDGSGQWVVTADASKDGCLIIWNIVECKPVFTLFNIYKESGILLLSMSGSARYLITIGNQNKDEYSIDFWLWTYGETKPDDSLCVSKSIGRPKKICFNPTVEEHIMVVFEKEVHLFVWDTEQKKITKHVIPQLNHKNKIGHLTGGTYLHRCHECFASSDTGCILIFGNTLYAKPYEETELDNIKIFVNPIKISPVSIGCITCADRVIVTGDKRGFIFFLDRQVRILYWLRNYNLGPITTIQFNLSPKFKHQEDGSNIHYAPKAEDNLKLPCNFTDKIEEMDAIMDKDLPVDASLDKLPFTVNDFFVATEHCNVYSVDCYHDQCISLFHVADDYVSAIETHEEMKYLLIGFANGRLTMINYETNDVIATTVLPKTESGNSIHTIKYSVESFHLACGRENGEIWILEPVMLYPKVEEPFKITTNAVIKITFSNNPVQFAYYDDNSTVILFSWDNDENVWRFRGKIRSHYADINDIMFVPSFPFTKLYTISMDRHLVEYNTCNLEEEEFGIKSRERIEQSAIPMTFMYMFENIANKQYGYILVADNMQKLKLLYQVSKVPKTIVLAPAFGCFKNQVIRKMRIIPRSNTRYLAFMTEKHIGIHLLPLDGNPYKYVGYLGHPDEVMDFSLSPDGQYIFTFGRQDHSVFKWKIKPRAVELMHMLGGKELEPFYCLIEGGKDGWLFQEIQDLFYYMQILQQENIDLPRRVSDCLPLSEVPDLVKTCGFYPSEFELENMMIDIRYRNFDDQGKINEEINFIDFVKLFCNHKPAYGYSKAKVKRAFDILLSCCDDFSGNGISKEDFLDILSTSGEQIHVNTIKMNLKTLLGIETEENVFDMLPDNISFDMLFEQIFGFDMDRDRIVYTKIIESDDEIIEDEEEIDDVD